MARLSRGEINQPKNFPSDSEKRIPENFNVPEKQSSKESTEQQAEKKLNQNQSSEKNTKKRPRLPTFHRATPLIPQRNEVTVKVEKILEEGLSEAFQNLSPLGKEEFKLKGEQTATKIQELLKSTHVKAKKIFKLIFEWLRLLPGINKFFLEQEAKIKTDRIITIKNKNIVG
jgi:hypothetical protein